MVKGCIIIMCESLLLSSLVTFIAFCNCNEYSLYTDNNSKDLNSEDKRVDATNKRSDQATSDATKTEEGIHIIF